MLTQTPIYGTAYQVHTTRPADVTLWTPALDRHQTIFGRAPDIAGGDRGFSSAGNEQAALDRGVRRVILPRRGPKSPARRAHERQRWFRRGQRWRVGCEGPVGARHQGHHERCRAQSPAHAAARRQRAQGQARRGHGQSLSCCGRIDPGRDLKRLPEAVQHNSYCRNPAGELEHGDGGALRQNIEGVKPRENARVRGLAGARLFCPLVTRLHPAPCLLGRW